MGRPHPVLRGSARRGAPGGAILRGAGAPEFMTLLELQRRMAADVMQSLTTSDHIAPKTGAGYVKPNDRLSSRERLEIYNRQYWFRVIDSMYEDFAGLCAVLGQRAFDRLVRAYVAERPSETF